MKNKAVILVSLFIAIVIYNAPVQLVKGMVDSKSGIKLSGLNGTLWSGSIDSIEIDGFQFQEAKYEIDFFPLLIGSISGSIRISRGAATGFLEFYTNGRDKLSFSEMTMASKAFILENQLPFPGISLGGDLSVKELSTDIEGGFPTELKGLTSWDAAEISINNNQFKLGRFQIDWKTDSEKQLLIGSVVKTQNSLDLDGQITINSNKHFEFIGTVSSKTDNRLYNALLFFADGKEKNSRLPIKIKKNL